MNKLKVILVSALLAGLSGTAAARDNVSFSISIGTPGYAYNYGNPRGYYYAPPPVYYAHPRAYYGPRTYYVPQPVMVAPRHDYYRHDQHYGRHHGDRHGRHRGHR